jgi:hypothetical protein
MNKLLERPEQRNIGIPQSFDKVPDKVPDKGKEGAKHTQGPLYARPNVLAFPTGLR